MLPPVALFPCSSLPSPPTRCPSPARLPTAQEEYLASKGQSLPEGWFKSDGRFKGWVAPDVCQKLGLATSAAEAWEQVSQRPRGTLSSSRLWQQPMQTRRCYRSSAQSHSHCLHPQQFEPRQQLAESRIAAHIDILDRPA